MSEGALCAAILSQRSNMLGWAIEFTRDVTDGEDLVQDTLERGFAHLKAFYDVDAVLAGNHSPLRAWLYTIMRNLMRNRASFGGSYRSRYRETEDPYELFAAGMAIQPAQEADLALSEIAQQIAKLSPDYQAI